MCIALSQTVASLEYQHQGLGGVLDFADVKMLIAAWVQIDELVSVGIIGTIIAAVVASLRERKHDARPPQSATGDS